jgi:REP element-mobilizing transposase RayT
MARPCDVELNPALSNAGEVVKKAIEKIPHIYKSVSVDKYVIMPNHVHIILIIDNDNGRAWARPYDFNGYQSNERLCF